MSTGEPLQPGDIGYAYFQRKLKEVLGIDLSQYRPEQMDRRLHGFLKRYPGETFLSLGRRLERDAVMAQELRDFLTINVTEFFRNPERYRDLERIVLPALAARGKPRIWSAGCSVGAEPYSLAMLLLEHVPAGGQVLGTDLDAVALARAQRGIYREAELRAVTPERLRRHFEAVGGEYRVKDEVRRLVRFEQHNLLADPFPRPWDLIVCRNVIIYFTEEARRRLFQGFLAALRPQGFLFIGSTESIPNLPSLALKQVAPFIYQRT